MVLSPVVSSNLSRVGYEDGTLYIEFKHGGLYSYTNVPPSIYHGLMQAASKGSFHAAYIKNSYPYQKLT